METLAAVKLEKHKNLGEEFSFFWREIDEGSLAFDRVQTEVRNLKARSPENLHLCDCLPGFCRKGLELEPPSASIGSASLLFRSPI